MKIGNINIEIPDKLHPLLAKAGKFVVYRDILFASAILGIIGVLLFPIPAWMVDFLLCISIAISVLIMMTVLFIDKPLDFSSFPTVLLVVTMLRLSLNIATTRLILGYGHTGADAAGHVVRAFGVFVMQGSVIIGAIVFGILTIINFVVITKGSGRIAEVAARFSLDAMPGKQMAIDSDLSSGLIDEKTAKQRRKELEEESTFFGSMDGANKFVRGDAIAGLLIIFINFIGGMIIGIVQKNMSFELALQTYTLLTIGDGLVAQIPALIVSIGAGLLVTKAGATGSADKAIFEQIGGYPPAMGISAGLLMIMAVMPGIPAIPFMMVAGILATFGFYLRQNQAKTAAEQDETLAIATADGSKASAGPGELQDDVLNQVMHIDIIRLELGYELLPLVNGAGQKLTEQIKVLRKQIAKDLGFVMPAVRIIDNMQMQPFSYIVKIKDMQCGTGALRPNKVLLMEKIGQEFDIPGENTTEPAFGINARWVDEAKREEAVFKGYTVVDPSTVMVTHLTELVKENIVEMLSYSAVQKLLDNLPPEHKKIVSDIIPSQIAVTTVHRILQGLLQENVSVRDLPTILEAIAEMASTTKNIMKLIEHVRTRLAKQICFTHTTDAGYIPILILSAAWDQLTSESLVGEGEEKALALPPSKLNELVGAINSEYDKHVVAGEIPVILVSPSLRPYIRMIVERFRPSITVLSQSEIHAKAKIRTVGQIS
ncbi:MAG: flagellar biosynthesis protein FlhA [Proteobacteria bacterium]|nr:flagellar biosynthesis protein FlhA [Pseudomonadota bacterium]